jgi:hypothetical protein
MTTPALERLNGYSAKQFTAKDNRPISFPSSLGEAQSEIHWV